MKALFGSSINIHATEALFRAEILSCSGHLRKVCRKSWRVTYLIRLLDIPTMFTTSLIQTTKHSSDSTHGSVFSTFKCRF